MSTSVAVDSEAPRGEVDAGRIEDALAPGCCSSCLYKSRMRRQDRLDVSQPPTKSEHARERFVTNCRVVQRDLCVMGQLWRGGRGEAAMRMAQLSSAPPAL